MNRSEVKSINTLLRKLTFDDLRDWAGEKILNRGMGYVKRVDLLIELSGRYPYVSQHIVEAEQLASGKVGKLVRDLRSEIRDLTAEPAWFNHWR